VNSKTPVFDIFLSYKSEDGSWVEQLKKDLQARGVRVWLDKDQIRPGDLFPRALEEGIATSRAVGLVVTPESTKSKWVQAEYYRALRLSKEKGLQLIPLLLRKAHVLGFLSDLQWIDFTDEARYDRNVDQLIWPGITGKHVRWCAVCPYFTGDGRLDVWGRLSQCCWHFGIDLHHFPGFERFYPYGTVSWSDSQSSPDSHHFANPRGVLVIDIFGYWPEEGRDMDWYSRYWGHSNTQACVEFIFGLRDETRNTPGELVFVLFHHSLAWETLPHNLDQETVRRLRHYFTIHGDVDDSTLRSTLHRTWMHVQRDLLRAEIAYS